MLEERIGGHEALVAGRQSPVAQRNVGDQQREAGHALRAQPTQPAEQDHQRAARFERDHPHRKQRCRRQPELSHLAQRPGEVRQLHDAALQVGRAQAQVGDEAHRRRPEQRPRGGASR